MRTNWAIGVGVALGFAAWIASIAGLKLSGSPIAAMNLTIAGIVFIVACQAVTEYWEKRHR